MTDDYQWPSASVGKRFVNPPASSGRLAAAARTVERFFERRLKVHAVLVPSARAGLTMLIHLHGLNRRHTVFAPKWSAACIWGSIGRLTNPSSSGPLDADMVIAVHKWGQVTRAHPRRRAILLEDSADSALTSNATMFPNGGAFELVSLPKIIGSIAGGMILTRDPDAAAELRSLRRNGSPLARYQTYLKYLGASGLRPRGYEHQSYHDLEAVNPGLDAYALSHIRARLESYDTNVAVIADRLSFLRRDGWIDRYVPRTADCGRLPPVLPVPCKAAPHARASRLMVRHFDFRRDTMRPAFEKAFLLPLHADVSDAAFARLYRDLRGARARA